MFYLLSRIGKLIIIQNLIEVEECNIEQKSVASQPLSGGSLEHERHQLVDSVEANVCDEEGDGKVQELSVSHVVKGQRVRSVACDEDEDQRANDDSEEQVHARPAEELEGRADELLELLNASRAALHAKLALDTLVEHTVMYVRMSGLSRRIVWCQLVQRSSTARSMMIGYHV